MSTFKDKHCAALEDNACAVIGDSAYGVEF